MPKPKTKRLITRYDGCCPNCAKNIGYHELMHQFHGMIFDADQHSDPMVEIECPECESLIQIYLLFDFAVKQTPFE